MELFFIMDPWKNFGSIRRGENQKLRSDNLNWGHYLDPLQTCIFLYNFHNKEFKHDICSYSIGKLHFLWEFEGELWRPRQLWIVATLLYARDQNATQIFKVVFLIPFKIYYLKIRVKIVTGLVLVYALTDFEPRY